MNAMMQICTVALYSVLVSVLLTPVIGFTLNTPSGPLNVNFNGTVIASLTPSQETYALPPSPSGNNLTVLEGPSTYGQAGVSFEHSSNSSTLFVYIAQTGLTDITSVQLVEIPNLLVANISDVVTALNSGVASSAGHPISTIEADRIYASPETFFIQILTATHPKGAIRGKLADNTSASGVQVPDNRLHADALTSNLVPHPLTDPKSASDSATCGLFVLNNSDGTTSTLNFLVTTSIVNDTSAAAIYNGTATQVGSVFVNLTTAIRLPSLNQNNVFRGSVSVPLSTANALLASPSSYYFQVDSQGAAVARAQFSNPAAPSPTAPPAPPPPAKVDPGPVLGGTAGNSSAGISVRPSFLPVALTLLAGGLLVATSF